MHPHEIHHIKAYIVFFIVSFVSIGLLIYLYLPIGKLDNMTSSVLQVADSVAPQEITPDNSPIIIEKKDNQDALSGHRMRLTQLLIRSKKELQSLENQRQSSSQGLDSALEKRIRDVTEKIGILEQKITDL